MQEFIRLFIGTVALRPYVFVFFAAYLFLAITSMGWRRTAVFTVLAYVIAFVCEWSSVHNGFPFGLYYYIATTTNQELWVAGVPFMDSLSFTFLSYVSFEMAIVLRSALIVRPFDVQVVLTNRVRRSWFTTFVSALLMMYLDIVIDPVALQGEKWFLGKIYYYPFGGSYFGVTIANFAGWFFVNAAIIRVYLVIERWLETWDRTGVWYYPLKGLSPAGLYFGILIFNVSVTFWIGEVTMGWASCFISATLLFLLVNHVSQQPQPPVKTVIEEHLRDFPESPLAPVYPQFFARGEL